MSHPGSAQTVLGDEHWDPQFHLQGPDGVVQVIVTNGCDLYIGGLFSFAGDTAANNLVRFDGLRWSPLGSGVRGPGLLTAVQDFAFEGTNVYVVGSFTNAGGIAATNFAHWDGTQWSSPGALIGEDPLTQTCYAITWFQGALYLGGIFTNAGCVSACGIARWDGENWSEVGGGLSNSVSKYIEARCFATDGQYLYVGGTFDRAGGVPANSIARWDGTSWSALGSGIGTGLSATVADLLIHNGTLYACGAFTNVGSVAATNVARWDGASWFDMGRGVSEERAPVYKLACINDQLYAGRGFMPYGGLKTNCIVRWNGDAWEEFGGGVRKVYWYPAVFGLAGGADGKLYAGGVFDRIGGNDRAAFGLAFWDGSTWSSCGGPSGKAPVEGTAAANMQGLVRSITVDGSDVYVGGSFAAVGDVASAKIARWDGTSWSSVGGGSLDSPLSVVIAIAKNGSDLYIGGAFTNLAGLTVANIARWNGTSWSPLGAGLNSAVYSMAFDGSDLYVGGSFTQAGGVTANRIAKWNGTTWSPLISGTSNGLSSTVYSILRTGPGSIYVGGSFMNAGGSGANRIAKWNGAAWSTLGSGPNNGVNNSVYTMLSPAPNIVYVGGSFTTAGGVSAKCLAQFDGAGWSEIGGGVTGVKSVSVRALAWNGNALYVGGAFTNAGGVDASSLARWDGTTWSALCSGVGREPGIGTVPPTVLALGIAGDDVYVGGMFHYAGGRFANQFARWNETRTFSTPSIIRLDSPSRPSPESFRCRITASSHVFYVVEASSDLGHWVPILTNSASPLQFTDPYAAGHPQRFYRGRKIDY